MTPVAAAAAELPATEVPPEEDDAFRLLAELRPVGNRKPLEAERWIALAPDGTYALLEFAGSTVRQIGPRVSFDDALDRAAAICAGCEHARTEPLAIHALALAIAGGVARKRHDEAERRRRFEAAKTEMTGGAELVSPPGAAGAVPTPAAPPVLHELLLAAKEAAVMLSEMAKSAGVSPRGPGFDRLMAAIAAASAQTGAAVSAHVEAAA